MVITPLRLIPIDTDGFHLHLDAEVNGIQVNLLLDTGASRSVFSSALVKAWDNKTEKQEHSLESFGMGGSFESYIAEVKTVKFGGKFLEDYILVVHDMSHISGIMKELGQSRIDGMLGGDLLNAVGAVIDYINGNLIIGKNKYPIQYLAPDIRGIEIFVETEINNKVVSCIIDTGASKSVFNPGTSRRVFRVSKRDLYENGHSGIGVNDQHMGDRVFEFDEISFNGVVFNDVEILSFDFEGINDNYKKMGVREIDGILGGDLLNEYGGVIDYAKLTLSFGSFLG
nr:aspartyl protease family protein [Bacteroidota bacterium]